jgi:hypothetical protein
MTIIFTGIFVFCLYIMVRNTLVLSTRNKMLDLIFGKEDWERYLSIYLTVSYDEMLYRFWIWPIHKMFPKQLRELIRKNP